MSTPAAAVVRLARPEDAKALVALVDALADYEKLARPDAEAKERLVEAIFAEIPRLRAYVAEADGVIAGYAFACETYSSFLAMPTLYVEDLFVLPEHRRRKLGVMLLRAIIEEAWWGGYGRIEWEVLEWNQLAIDFYEKLGAKRKREWFGYRLTRDDMKRILG